MIYSFLMVGQSNMAGRGDFGEVPVIEDARMLMLRNGHWVPMSEPIKTDKNYEQYHNLYLLPTTFIERKSTQYNLTKE